MRAATVLFIALLAAHLVGAAEPPRDTLPAPAGKPAKRPPPEAEADAALEAVLGPPSDAYAERGYAGLKFGTPKADLEKAESILGRSAGTPWWGLKGGKEALFDADGALVGVSGVLARGDNKSALAKIIDTFGSADKRNIEGFKLVDTFVGSREDVVRVSYRFPEALVVVRLTEKSFVVGGSVRTTELATFAAFDRRWAGAELAADAAAKRKSLEWFREVVGAVKSGGYDKDKLPALKDAKTEEKGGFGFSPPGGLFWSPKEGKPAEADKPGPPRDPNGPDPEWFAIVGVQEFAQPRLPKGTVICRARWSKVPGVGERPVSGTALGHLVTRGESELAQEFFPPRGESITATTPASGFAKVFEWRTKEGLEVRVTSDHLLEVIRRPDE